MRWDGRVWRLRAENGHDPQGGRKVGALLAACCASYEIDTKEQLVIHHVHVDAVPNSIGTLRKRHFEFSGKHLILRPVPPLPEGVTEYSLTWERIEEQ